MAPELDSGAALPSDELLQRMTSLLLSPASPSLAELRIALGCSPAELSAGIEFLRSLGAELCGDETRGYHLEGEGDLLTPEHVTPLLRTRRLGRRIEHFFVVDSTQQAALAAAHRGAPDGSLFIAELQTAGRGRHGHRWHSAPSQGIYCTLLLRPEGPPSGLLPLILASGLAVAEAVHNLTGLRPEIRWPNDLLLQGRKFCGILIEISAEQDRVQHALLGVGVNVHQRDFGEELAPIATSLHAASGVAVSRPRLLAEMLLRLEHWLDRLQQEGKAAVLAAFQERSGYARGLPVRVGFGSESYTGVTAGLDADGFLLVQREDGTMATVLSGEVRPLESREGQR